MHWALELRAIDKSPAPQLCMLPDCIHTFADDPHVVVRHAASHLKVLDAIDARHLVSELQSR